MKSHFINTFGRYVDADDISGGYAGRMTFRADRRNNDLPRLPPGRELETRSVLKACIEARAALAEVRIAGQLIPNRSILVSSIPLLEAQASSEIENIVTTTDQLLGFANEPGNGADPATKEALRYRTD